MSQARRLCFTKLYLK